LRPTRQFVAIVSEPPEPAAEERALELGLFDRTPSAEEKAPAVGGSEAMTGGIHQALQDVYQRS